MNDTVYNSSFPLSTSNLPLPPYNPSSLPPSHAHTLLHILPTSPSLPPSFPVPLPRPTHPTLERVHRGVLHHPGELPAAQQEARECRQPQHRGDETSVWPCCVDCMLRLDQSQREVKAPNVLAISIF